MYFLSNQQEDHYFEANSRQFQTGRPVELYLCPNSQPLGTVYPMTTYLISTVCTMTVEVD